MTIAREMARFVVSRSYAGLSPAAVRELKVRVLDSLGCAFGALDAPPMHLVRQQIEEFGGAPLCTLIGGARSAPDRAALANCALVRYLDFNDSYLAKGETCHPSDNLGAVLAAAEYARQSGKELLVALATAYQVQCRLSDVAPVRNKGFDHTTQGSFAVAAGVARALGLGEAETTSAIAICGTAFNALRVTRTGRLSNWKGLAYPNTAFACTHATFLAMRGITGPEEVFEGDKGFMAAISGPFSIDWPAEDSERVTQTILKKYNAEVHSQSTLEGVLELREEHGFRGGDVAGVEIETFDVAFNIIGGGEEGDKTVVQTKEQADHSLPYMVAAAILDGHVGPEQYQAERISRPDVQGLLRKVTIRPNAELSRLFPQEMPARITIRLRDGRVLAKEKRDYEGFHTRPMPWPAVAGKFEQLSSARVDGTLRRDIIAAVESLDNIAVGDLTSLLSRVRINRQRDASGPTA